MIETVCTIIQTERVPNLGRDTAACSLEFIALRAVEGVRTRPACQFGGDLTPASAVTLGKIMKFGAPADAIDLACCDSGITSDRRSRDCRRDYCKHAEEEGKENDVLRGPMKAINARKHVQPPLLRS
jgi:hypothetical protein